MAGPVGALTGACLAELYATRYKPGFSNTVQTALDLEVLADAARKFVLDCGRPVGTDEGLRALVLAPPDVADRWKGPYVRLETLKDPLGRDYQYHYPGVEGSDTFDLFTLGSEAYMSGKSLTM